MTETHHTHSRAAWIKSGVAALFIAAIAAGFIYWRVTETRVYIESASIQAPLINLAASEAGTLQEVYVHEGDIIPANATVARVGDQLIQSKVAGLIVSVPETIGAQAKSGEAVVTMIDPTQLRVVGKVDEDKGLSRIQVGQSVAFTVDAMGGKEFSAIVDEIAPTSEQSGVVFNISDKRETKQFEVKARYDTSALPELKNGMSARMWVYTQ